MSLKGEACNLFWVWKAVSVSNALLIWGKWWSCIFYRYFVTVALPLLSFPAVLGCRITAVRSGKSFLAFSPFSSVWFALLAQLSSMPCWGDSSTARALLLPQNFYWLLGLLGLNSVLISSPFFFFSLSSFPLCFLPCCFHSLNLSPISKSSFPQQNSMFWPLLALCISLLHCSVTFVVFLLTRFCALSFVIPFCVLNLSSRPGCKARHR